MDVDELVNTLEYPKMDNFEDIDFEGMVKLLKMHFPTEEGRVWFNFQRLVKAKLRQRIEFLMGHRRQLVEFVDDVFDVTNEWVQMYEDKPGYRLHYRDQDIGLHFFTMKEEDQTNIYCLDLKRNTVYKFYPKYLEYFNPFYHLHVDATKTAIGDYIFPTKYLITIGVEGFEKAFKCSGWTDVDRICFTPDKSNPHRIMLRVKELQISFLSQERMEQVYFQLFHDYEEIELNRGHLHG